MHERSSLNSKGTPPQSGGVSTPASSGGYSDGSMIYETVHPTSGKFAEFHWQPKIYGTGWRIITSPWCPPDRIYFESFGGGFTAVKRSRENLSILKTSMCAGSTGCGCPRLLILAGAERNNVNESNFGSGATLGGAGWPTREQQLLRREGFVKAYREPCLGGKLLGSGHNAGCASCQSAAQAAAKAAFPITKTTTTPRIVTLSDGTRQGRFDGSAWQERESVVGLWHYYSRVLPRDIAYYNEALREPLVTLTVTE